MGTVIISVLAGTIFGVFSGFGVGGGSLLLLWLTAAAGLDQHQAQSINLLYFLPTAAAALPAHAKRGDVEKSVLLPAVISGLIFTVLAALAATALDVTLLHRLFGGFLLFTGIRELLRREPDRVSGSDTDGT